MGIAGAHDTFLDPPPRAAFTLVQVNLLAMPDLGNDLQILQSSGDEEQ